MVSFTAKTQNNAVPWFYWSIVVTPVTEILFSNRLKITELLIASPFKPFIYEIGEISLYRTTSKMAQKSVSKMYTKIC
jgi:hypothetical protein